MNEEMSGGLNILVSVNCTTFNHEKYIAQAIESFINQKTNFNYEILIGEDCSTDNTRKVVEEYVRLYPEKIKMVTSPMNVGARKNSQRLIEMSRGKYIAECEGDDYWTDPYKLQKQVDYMESHPDCSLCFHSAEIIQAPSHPTGRFIRPYTRDTISPIEDIITGGGGFCPTPSLFYPRKYMLDPPEFYKTAPIGDYPMQMLLASQGYAYYIDQSMCAYRSGVEGSWTNSLTFAKDIREKLIHINRGIVQLLREFNEYTTQKYNDVIDRLIRRLDYEIIILTGESFTTKEYRFSTFYKLKIRSKIFIRCNYPNIYLKLSSLKTTKTYAKLKV